MIVIGINTSTPEGGVALMGDEGLIAEYSLHSKATHSERLLPSIDRLLQDTELTFRDLSGIAVAVGPGSFTGLRIGLASAKGLALSSDLPLVGIPTLPALARNLPFCAYAICPMIIARKKEVYWALYRFKGGHLMEMEEETVSPPEVVAKRIGEPTVFLGDGATEHSGQIREILGEKAIFAPLAVGSVRASQVAEMGRERLIRGERDDLATLVPRYIRRSEAEIKWGIKIGD